MKDMKKAEIVKRMTVLYRVIQNIIDRFKELGLPDANGYPSANSLSGSVKSFLKLPIEKREHAIEEMEKMQKEVDKILEENGLKTWIIQEFERFAHELKHLDEKKLWHDFDHGVRFRVSMETTIKILRSFGFEVKSGLR